MDVFVKNLSIEALGIIKSDVISIQLSDKSVVDSEKNVYYKGFFSTTDGKSVVKQGFLFQCKEAKAIKEVIYHVPSQRFLDGFKAVNHMGDEIKFSFGKKIDITVGNGSVNIPFCENKASMPVLSNVNIFKMNFNRKLLSTVIGSAIPMEDEASPQWFLSNIGITVEPANKQIFILASEGHLFMEKRISAIAFAKGNCHPVEEQNIDFYVKGSLISNALKYMESENVTMIFTDKQICLVSGVLQIVVPLSVVSSTGNIKEVELTNEKKMITADNVIKATKSHVLSDTSECAGAVIKKNDLISAIKMHLQILSREKEKRCFFSHKKNKLSVTTETGKMDITTTWKNEEVFQDTCFSLPFLLTVSSALTSEYVYLEFKKNILVLYNYVNEKCDDTVFIALMPIMGYKKGEEAKKETE